MNKAKFVLHPNKSLNPQGHHDKPWFWSLRTANGQVLVVSGSYNRKRAARNAITTLRNSILADPEIEVAK